MNKITVMSAAAGVLALAGSAIAGPIAIGSSAFKTHPTVPDMPKYTIGLPAYFTAGNVVASLVNAAVVGQLAGSVTTTVYRNPDTGFLTFQYEYNASAGNNTPVVRATMNGQWLNFDVLDAGSDASGNSGSGDPNAEWTDGDPLFLARAPDDGAPNVQWRAFGLGSALNAGDFSANVWFATNATEWEQQDMAWIDTAQVGEGLILAPAPAQVIPLPSAAGLGALGMGLAVSYGRRRR
ncbi:MAG: hypothetical protein H7Y88_09915 [Phycisphaerales bacterium]|nr:hypothetical protein [Phycisphaerales bacterium]